MDDAAPYDEIEIRETPAANNDKYWVPFGISQYGVLYTVFNHLSFMPGEGKTTLIIDHLFNENTK